MGKKHVAVPKKMLAGVLAMTLSASLIAVAPASALAASKPKVATPTVSKVVPSAKGFTVKWKKMSAKKVNGYQVRYATNAKMKSAKTLTIKKASTASKTSPALKSATTYYVKVRAYKKVGKKTYYSPWSKAKTVTTKLRSGDATLDKGVNNILDKKTGRNGKTSLKKAFDYVSKMPYASKGNTQPKGKWNITGAKKMIANKGGNCYESAALFCWLAKGMGYEAKAVSGKTSGRAHGWVEVKIGGKWYICDPNNTNTLLRFPDSKVAKQIVEEKGLALDSCLFLQPKDDTLFKYTK